MTKFACILLCCLALLLPATVKAQFADSTAIGDVELPPLDTLLHFVTERSPTLKMYRALTEKRRAELARARFGPLEGLTATVIRQAGSYGNAEVDAISIGTTAGVAFRVSIGDLLAQKSAKAIHQNNIEAAIQKEGEAELLLTQRVSELYYALRLAQRLVKVKNETYQATQLQYQMAEEEFGQGRLSLADLATVTGIASKAATEYEVARSDYLAYYYKLEDWTGCRLSTMCRDSIDAAIADVQ